jgi:dolichyl-diphosphooligosaccharide--protein glycosyltransferase
MYGNRWVIAWGNFNVGFFLSFVSFLVLIYLIIKNGDAGNSLLWIWSVVMLVATLGQRRFGYYYSVNVALLTGYIWWKVYEASGQKWLTNILEEIAARRKTMKIGRRRSGSSLGLNYVVLVLASLVCLVTLFFGAFFWNIEPALAVASTAPYAPSDAWVASLDWLRQNSPEPLGSADAYYKVEPALTGGQTYQYPDTAYGVLAWWDYGYWITRIAHRIPNANPSQDPKAIYNVASFFTSQNETAAGEIRQQLGSEYVVIDQDTALSKFWAIVTWAQKSPYFDNYLIPQQDGTYQTGIAYYPEYYRSMAVRMYNFDCKAVTSNSTLVISYTENKDAKGNPYKVLTGGQQFGTYEAAEQFTANQTSGNWRIVGADPMVSPVPLEALEHYSVVYRSNQTASTQTGAVPAVKIFKYIK